MILLPYPIMTFTVQITKQEQLNEAAFPWIVS